MHIIFQNIVQDVQRYSSSDLTSTLGIVAYILQAWALYTIAERRGINKAWLAWVPVVNVWILGSISDQYQYVAKRKIKNKRKILLGLQIAVTAIAVFLVVFLFVSVLAGLLSMEPTFNEMPSRYDDGQILGALLLMVLLALVVAVAGIIITVYTYMALYDVFCSCEPKNGTLYTVLSLVVGMFISGAHCIFLMLCKDKDLGMPPRKTEVAEQIPQNTAE